MPKLRVHNFSITLDGYAAGPNQSLENPFGEGVVEGTGEGARLHDWMFTTRTGRQMFFGDDGGEEGVDDDFVAQGDVNIGATIMGRNMFGPLRGPWADEAWKGWWGDNPGYHHPVFVLTHHPRPSITMQGGTTYHFVDNGIEAALERAFDAAGGKDVRLGGGASTIQQYLSRASSTRCTWRSCPSCSAGANGSSTTSMAARKATHAPGSSLLPTSRTRCSPERWRSARG